jgi:hypothetical protein
MNDLKETFKIDYKSDLKDLILKAGNKLNWEPVSISNNNIEFNYSQHLSKFYTIISWSNDGFINLSTNYKLKSTKIDLGGYRKSNNEKIKISVLREVSILENNAELIDNNSIINKEREIDKNDGNDKVAKNTKHDFYSQQIAEKNKTQNSKLIRIAVATVVIIALIKVSFLIYEQTTGKTCGCSENEIIGIQKARLVTRAEAIDFCCELQKIADEINKNQR